MFALPNLVLAAFLASAFHGASTYAQNCSQPVLDPGFENGLTNFPWYFGLAEQWAVSWWANPIGPTYRPDLLPAIGAYEGKYVWYTQLSNAPVNDTWNIAQGVNGCTTYKYLPSFACVGNGTQYTFYFTLNITDGTGKPLYTNQYTWIDANPKAWSIIPLGSFTVPPGVSGLVYMQLNVQASGKQYGLWIDDFKLVQS